MFNKTNYISVFIILVALVLNSCSVTKPYSKPEITETDYILRLDSLKLQNDSINLLSWKEFFTDPVLVNYIDTALVYNHNNLIAYKNIKIFIAQYKRDKLGQLPTFNLNAGINRFDVKLPFPQEFTQFSLDANMSWEADLWGKIKSQKLATKSEFLKSITAQKLLQTQIISDVATTYYQLLEADKRKQILEQNILLRKESVYTLKNLKETGLSNSLGVNQAKAQLGQAEILLTTVNDQIFNLENVLVILVGRPISEFKRNALDEQSLETDWLTGIPLHLLENRPDVKVAELEFANSFQNFNVAKASLYPTIRLTASSGFQSTEIDNLLDPKSIFSNLFGGITAPILNGRALKTRKEVSKLQMEQNALRFKQTVLSASIEISDLLKSIETSKENLANLEQQENVLLGSYNDSKELLKAGMANYLNVLTAQENLLNAQIQKTNSQLLVLRNTALLYKALGGGK